MQEHSVNFVAVLVAGAAYMMLGALWYSPMLFGNAWMKAIGKTKEQIAADFTPMTYVWAFIGSFVAAYGIARILHWMGGGAIKEGLMLGFLCGVCFVLTTTGINDLFERRPRGLTMMNVLYPIVGFLIIGVIVGAWQ